MKQNCVDLEYKKYPAQMLEVAGHLRRAPAKFENPGLSKVLFPKRFVKIIDGSKKPKRQLALELQSSRVFEMLSN